MNTGESRSQGGEEVSAQEVSPASIEKEWDANSVADDLAQIERDRIGFLLDGESVPSSTSGLTLDELDRLCNALGLSEQPLPDLVEEPIDTRYEHTERTFMQLYAVDDPYNALHAIAAAAVLNGVAIVNLDAWFPRDLGSRRFLHYYGDNYSYSARLAMEDQFRELSRDIDDNLLDTISKSVAFQDSTLGYSAWLLLQSIPKPIRDVLAGAPLVQESADGPSEEMAGGSESTLRLGFGVIDTPLVRASVLAMISGDPAEGTAIALIAIQGSGGALRHLVRVALYPTELRDGTDEDQSLDDEMAGHARKMIRICCGCVK